MEKRKDMENHIKKAELFMKVNGKMIKKMEKGKKHGQMVQFMKVIFLMMQKMD